MTAPLDTARGAPASVEIVRGVAFPDWSAAPSPRARAALEALIAVEALDRRWAGLGADEDRVRRAVLAHYLAAGRAPTVAEAAGAAGVAEAEAGRLLAALQARDMVVFDGGALVGAYPFTDRDTGHRVRLGGVALHAMCAVDALGAGAMAGRDAVVDSRCRQCGAAVRVATRGAGAALASVTPPGAVVWLGLDYRGCAADSVCRHIAFFCSDADLERWRRAAGPVEGHRLAMAEALEVGRAFFAPLLADAAETERS